MVLVTLVLLDNLEHLILQLLIKMQEEATKVITLLLGFYKIIINFIKS